MHLVSTSSLMAFLLRNKEEGGKSREGKANVSKNIKLSDETEQTWRLVEGIKAAAQFLKDLSL